MKTLYYSIILLLVMSLFSACRPYKYGVIFKPKGIKESFPEIIETLELREGVVFADVGAQSGVFDAAMATLTKGVTYYIQDIDQKALNKEEWRKIVRYYSEKNGVPIAQRNQFHLVIGNPKKTNLPNNTFDIIYTNATFHAIRYKKAMMQDIHQKLKPGGYLFVRDKFVKKGVVERCIDEKCATHLATEEELMKVMKASRFKLVKKTPDFQGYPMYKFQKVQ